MEYVYLLIITLILITKLRIIKNLKKNIKYVDELIKNNITIKKIKIHKSKIKKFDIFLDITVLVILFNVVESLWNMHIINFVAITYLLITIYQYWLKFVFRKSELRLKNNISSNE